MTNGLTYWLTSIPYLRVSSTSTSPSLRCRRRVRWPQSASGARGCHPPRSSRPRQTRGTLAPRRDQLCNIDISQPQIISYILSLTELTEGNETQNLVLFKDNFYRENKTYFNFAGHITESKVLSVSRPFCTVDAILPSVYLNRNSVADPDPEV